MRRYWLESVLISIAFAAAALAVRFEAWIWLRAVAAGVAAAGLVGAAFYNRQMALETRRQVGVSEKALERAEEEARQRTREAQEARELAQSTLLESVKARYDQSAPRVAVINSHSLLLTATREIEGLRNQHLGWEEIPEYLSATDTEHVRIRLTLRFHITNFGDLPVPLFIPPNPLTAAVNREGHQYLMPTSPTEPQNVRIRTRDPARLNLEYYIEADFHQWQQIMVKGYGEVPSDDPKDACFLQYEFVVSDPARQVTDTHIWTADIRPFLHTGDGRLQKSAIPVNGAPVARIERHYTGLEEK